MTARAVDMATSLYPRCERQHPVHICYRSLSAAPQCSGQGGPRDGAVHVKHAGPAVVQRVRSRPRVAGAVAELVLGVDTIPDRGEVSHHSVAVAGDLEPARGQRLRAAARQRHDRPQQTHQQDERGQHDQLDRGREGGMSKGKNAGAPPPNPRCVFLDTVLSSLAVRSALRALSSLPRTQTIKRCLLSRSVQTEPRSVLGRSRRGSSLAVRSTHGRSRRGSSTGFVLPPEVVHLPTTVALPDAERPCHGSDPDRGRKTHATQPPNHPQSRPWSENAHDPAPKPPPSRPWSENAHDPAPKPPPSRPWSENARSAAPASTDSPRHARADQRPDRAALADFQGAARRRHSLARCALPTPSSLAASNRVECLGWPSWWAPTTATRTSGR